MQGGRSIRIPHHRLRRPTARMVRNGRQRKQHGGGPYGVLGFFIFVALLISCGLVLIRFALLVT